MYNDSGALAYFAFRVLAKYTGERLTKRAFAHLLKLAW